MHTRIHTQMVALLPYTGANPLTTKSNMGLVSCATLLTHGGQGGNQTCDYQRLTG